MLDLIQTGGPFMTHVFLVGAMVLTLIGAQLLLRHRDLAPLMIAGIILTLLVGGLGTVQGCIEAFRAVAQADAAAKTELLSKGLAVALYTTIEALVLASLQSALAGVVIFVHRLRPVDR